jgi:DNA-directed RNA polymerase subunit beta'
MFKPETNTKSIFSTDKSIVETMMNNRNNNKDKNQVKGFNKISGLASPRSILKSQEVKY